MLNNDVSVERYSVLPPGFSPLEFFYFFYSICNDVIQRGDLAGYDRNLRFKKGVNQARQLLSRNYVYLRHGW